MLAGDLLFLDFFGPFLIIPAALAAFALVGGLLSWRVPANAVGWLLSLAGFLFELTLLSGGYAYHALVSAPGSLLAGELATWLSTITWVPGIASVVFASILFPTGGPPSSRWRPLLVVVSLVLIAGVFAYAFGQRQIVLPRPLEFAESPTVDQTIDNPLALAGAPGMALRTFADFWDRWTTPIVLLAPAAVIARFRRARGVERQQLKWFAFSATVGLTILFASFVMPDPGQGGARELADALWVSGVIVIGLIPVSIAIAILRYRLYDIDVLINRTLVYTATTVGIALAFFGGIVVLQSVLRPMTAGNELAVAGSTLLSFALFQPLRRRFQEAVDRRFNRARYDAEQTIERFSSLLRDQVDLEALDRELLAIIGATVQPRHASIWLRAPSGGVERMPTG
jgi:hypothetical protein